MSHDGRPDRDHTPPGAASIGWPATVEVGELVERLPAALLLLTLAGSEGTEPVVTASNAAARQLLGRARYELHSVPLRTLLSGGGRAADRQHIARANHTPGPNHTPGQDNTPEPAAAPTDPASTDHASTPPPHPQLPTDGHDDLTRETRAWRTAGQLVPGRLTLPRADGGSAVIDGCALPPAPGRLPLVLLHLRRTEDGAVDRVRALERRVAELTAQINRRLVAEQRLRELLAQASDEVDAARESEEHFRLAFENAPVGTAVVDLDGRILRGNRALATLLGRRVSELSQLHMADVTHPEDLDLDAPQLVDLVAGRSTGYRVDKRLLRPDDAEAQVAMTVSLSRAGDGTPGQLVVQVEDVAAQRAAEAELERLALHDGLTGLPNRLLLRDRVRQGLHRLDRGSSGCGLLFVDLDKFKFVNDAYGHDVGDALLVEIAQRISGTLRSSDTAARLGGDEFVVLCENVPDQSTLAVAAERFERAIVRPVRIGGLTLSVTASVGLTHTTDPAADPDELLRQADLAMYRAKEGGRARAEPFDPGLATAAQERTALERDLRRGIDQGDLVLHYQPIIDLRTTGLARVEALVRWRHPQRGLLHPSAFIDLAEHTGLVVPLGEYVLREACTTLANWNARSACAVGLSVNVSTRQLSRTGFADVVAEVLDESGLRPDLLQLEITESVLAQTSPVPANELAVLKGLGVGLGLDDFGTGFSSLGYLTTFPVDVIKIDRGFVAAVGSSRADAAIVRSVVELSRELDLECVAEGIETREQAETLADFGSSHGQGYLFSRPVPFSKIADGSWARAEAG